MIKIWNLVMTTGNGCHVTHKSELPTFIVLYLQIQPSKGCNYEQPMTIVWYQQFFIPIKWSVIGVVLFGNGLYFPFSEL